MDAKEMSQDSMDDPTCKNKANSIGDNKTSRIPYQTHSDQNNQRRGILSEGQLKQAAQFSRQMSIDYGSMEGAKHNVIDWNDVTRQCGGRSIQHDSFADKLQGSCWCTWFIPWLTKIFPILTAFNDYNLSSDLITDLFAGFTMAVMHIPQGMAYGLLAGTEPIYGLYVSLIPVMIISFLSTTRHVSYGTFAIISLMLASSISNVNQALESRLGVTSNLDGNRSGTPPLQAPVSLSGSFSHHDPMMESIVITDKHQPMKSPSQQTLSAQYGNPHHYPDAKAQPVPSTSLHDVNGSLLSDDQYHQNYLAATVIDLIEKPDPIEILTVLCFLVGIIQISMALLRLGILSMVFSDELVSSFTTACAVQVATSQLDVLFDIELPTISNGLFKTCRIWYAFAENLISGSNLCTVVMSVISLAFLITIKCLLEPWLKEKIHISTLPSEILLMVVMIFVSYSMRLNEIYGVKILGAIPTGLPTFEPPRTDLIEYAIADSLVIAVVSFALNLSIVQIYAKRFREKVDANQELFSIGTANLISSFFWCFPCAASLSRSAVQSNLNVKSPLATLFGCSILVCIVCYWAPLFYYLPTSTLACIIVVALKGILAQVTDLVNSWKSSKLDGLVWMVTFLSVIIAGVTIGLIVGVVSTLSVMFYRYMVKSSAPPLN